MAQMGSGQPYSPTARGKIAQMGSGQPYSPTARGKIAQMGSGQPYSPTDRGKIAQMGSGQPYSQREDSPDGVRAALQREDDPDGVRAALQREDDPDGVRAALQPYRGVTNDISFHARVGRFSPFLYLRSVAIAVILFWLQLVVLSLPVFLGFPYIS